MGSIQLTDRELKVLKESLESGIIRRSQFSKYWASQGAVTEKIRRFINLGIIEVTDRFDIFRIRKENINGV